MRRTLIRSALIATLFGTAPASWADSFSCPEARLPPIALSHLRKAVTQGDEITFVALGSSSTEGIKASDPGHSYPAVLQEKLSQALPKSHVTVINRGIGGEDAKEEVARLQRDVLAIRPEVVIWQVGANGAMGGTAPEVFEEMVTTGVRALKAAKIDVILMDNQRSPKILASPDHAKIDQALADVAGREGARLFARGSLMELWQEAGHPYAEFLAGDGVHHNDRGYHCLAQALASSIVAGLGPRAAQMQVSR